ncbi:hypothetical protein L7F22_065019 [Adiantum nelumboides]|nr:hypothetical protein [Adiantum nelumboides]
MGWIAAGLPRLCRRRPELVFFGRAFSSNASAPGRSKESNGSTTVQIQVPFSLHNLSEGPPVESHTSKNELLQMYTDMLTIRRMEISADLLFKSQQVRGFCHLYDGQEAVAIGLKAAISKEDAVITAYRDHGIYLAQGGTAFEVFSELMGRVTGCAAGKGGSMHLYKRENNFFGGWGIVGTTPPLGAGLALALKYCKKKNVAVAIYGDGADNQITEQINDISFRLRLPDTWKFHNVFHVNLWKTFGDVPDDGEPDEQPEEEANEEILVPEQVLAHKVTKKGKARRRFLIKFKNFPAFDAKWMEEEDLADTPQILKLYLEAFGVIEGDYNVFKRGGQVYEAKNIAALWDLPLILLIENNHFGMGTAEWRAAKKASYFDRVSYVPGIKADGMDIFAVKEALLFCKEHCLAGKGPIVMECDTYRYHGHSMSDPGSTYRSRDEIKQIRQARDPIQFVKQIILKEELVTEEELATIDKQVKKEVEDALSKAREAPEPKEEQLITDMYKHDKHFVVYGCDRKRATSRLA